jgi:hypothetical protein
VINGVGEIGRLSTPLPGSIQFRAVSVGWQQRPDRDKSLIWWHYASNVPE